MRVRAISFEGGGNDLEDVLRLDGLTVVYGPNGAGKTRLLEAVAGILDPQNEPSRDVRVGEPTWAFGRAFVELEDVYEHSSDWRWLKESLVWSDRKLDLKPDWPNARDLLHDGDMYWDDKEYEELIDELIDSWPNDPNAEEFGYELFFCRMCDAIQARIPDDLPVRFLDQDMTSQGPASLLSIVFQRPLVSVQNRSGGFIGWAWDPSAEPEKHLEFIRSAAAALLPVANDRLTRSIVETVLAPGGAPRELFSLAVQGDSELVPNRLAELVWVPVDGGDAGLVVDHTVDQLRSTQQPGWLDQTESAFRLNESVLATLAEVAASANQQAPPFVGEQGLIELDVAPPQDWQQGSPKTLVLFRLDGGERVDSRALGAGTRRWVHAAVAEAARQALREHQAMAEHRPPLTHRVYLVDEPELHLHPTAQRDVLDWLRQLTTEGDSVVAASHSPAMLDGADHAIGLHRIGGRPILHHMDDDLLGAIDDLALQLGLDRGTWLQITRAVLIVEGQHDLLILRRFFGPQLERQRVRILALRGTGNTKALIESQFLGDAGIRLLVMFDAVREAALAGQLTEQVTPEERKMLELLKGLGHQEAAGHHIEPVVYEEPDIICALPAVAIRRAYPSARELSWDQIIDSWEQDPSRGFKPFALAQFGLKGTSPDAFVRTVLDHCRETDRPSHHLELSMQRLDQFLDNN